MGIGELSSNRKRHVSATNGAYLGVSEERRVQITIFGICLISLMICLMNSNFSLILQLRTVKFLFILSSANSFPYCLAGYCLECCERGAFSSLLSPMRWHSSGYMGNIRITIKKQKENHRMDRGSFTLSSRTWLNNGIVFAMSLLIGNWRVMGRSEFPVKQ